MTKTKKKNPDGEYEFAIKPDPDCRHCGDTGIATRFPRAGIKCTCAAGREMAEYMADDRAAKEGEAEHDALHSRDDEGVTPLK